MINKTTLTAEQIKAIIFEMIENTMERGNAGISVSFMSDGNVYTNIYPMNYGEEEEAVADV